MYPIQFDSKKKTATNLGARSKCMHHQRVQPTGKRRLQFEPERQELANDVKNSRKQPWMK